MSTIALKGRLGVEVVDTLKGCCIDSILAWRPSLVGQKNRCLYCDNAMKSVRAGEVNDRDFSGYVGDFSKAADAELVVSEICFSKKRFETPASVQDWCVAREVPAFKTIVEEDMAWRVKMAEVTKDSIRAVWAAPGVVAVLGLSKDAIAANSMVSGGMLAPAQGGGLPQRQNGDEKDTTTEDKDLLSAFDMKLNTLIKR